MPHLRAWETWGGQFTWSKLMQMRTLNCGDSEFKFQAFACEVCACTPHQLEQFSWLHITFCGCAFASFELMRCANVYKILEIFKGTVYWGVFLFWLAALRRCFFGSSRFWGDKKVLRIDPPFFHVWTSEAWEIEKTSFVQGTSICGGSKIGKKRF